METLHWQACEVTAQGLEEKGQGQRKGIPRKLLEFGWAATAVQLLQG